MGDGTNDIPGEMSELLASFQEGSLDAAGRSRLAELLRDDPQARRTYVRLIGIDVLLEEELSGQTAALPFGIEAPDADGSLRPQTLPAADMLVQERAMVLPAIRAAEDDEELLAAAPDFRPPAPAAPRWHQKPMTRWAAGILLALAGLATWAALRPGPAQPVGSLASVFDAHWLGAARTEGMILREHDRIQLQAGLVEVKLASGARVVVEGPADVELLGVNRASVRSGIVAAYVPPAAHGFQVDASGLTVIDEGTEFGLSVAPDTRAAEVHVFEGRVSVAPPRAANGPAPSPVRLVRGEAVRCDVASGGALQTMPAVAEPFMRVIAQIAPGSAAATPLPVAVYSFDDTAGEIVADSATSPADGKLWGGATRVAGRVGSGALHVGGKNDCVVLGNPSKLDISGRLTIAAWVIVEDPAGRYQNVVARGFKSSPAPGEIYLRLKDGQFEFGTWNAVPSPYSDPLAVGSFDHKVMRPVTPDFVGRWVHLAGTYDGTTWRLYLDGQPAASYADPVGATKVNANWLIGASTGGIAEGKPNGRYFKGSIDDVRLYNTALTAEQIGGLATVQPAK